MFCSCLLFLFFDEEDQRRPFDSDENVFGGRSPKKFPVVILNVAYFATAMDIGDAVLFFVFYDIVLFLGVDKRSIIGIQKKPPRLLRSGGHWLGQNGMSSSIAATAGWPAGG